mgnify:CR=1 FL=1|jgi:hypothetical protein
MANTQMHTLHGKPILWKYKERYEPVHEYLFDVVCPLCSRNRDVSIPAPELFNWHHNNPTRLSASDLEALNTGICDPCWDNTMSIFGTETKGEEPSI